jgi:PAS domain S-box-containing protein
MSQTTGLLVLAAILALLCARLAWRLFQGRRARQALIEAERDYRSIFDNAIDGIYRSSPDGRQLRANPALVRLNGYASEAEMLSSVNDIATEWYVEPGRRAEFMRTLEEQGRVENFVSEIYRHKTRERIWVSENARLVRDARGRPLFYEGTVRDITELRRAEAAATAARYQAEAANQAKSAFLARISHELRTPLNAILGFSEMLRSEWLGPLGNRRYREFADDIFTSGTHLLSLIDDILDLSRIEAGRVELREEVFPVADLVDAVFRFLHARAESGRLAFTVDLPDELPPIRADRRAMKQVLLNLLSNAIKFTPAGGRVACLANHDADGAIRLQVLDTGIGIAAADIARVLEPFGQIDSGLARQHRGAGLGLPISRALVELHGGRFDLASEPGKGTTASIWLPPERVVLPAHEPASRPHPVTVDRDPVLR